MTDRKHKVATTDELAAKSRITVEMDGIEIGVFRNDDEYHALLNYCVHQSGPLCEGGLSGKMEVDDEFRWSYDDEPRVVTCPWHNWKFDIKTGTNIHDESYQVPTFDVEVKDGDVYVII